MHRFVAILGICGAACDGGQPAVVDAPSIDAAAPPTLAVTASPATVARGETVTFTVTVANFTIVNPTAVAPKDGEGHFHYYVDDAANYTAAWTPTVSFRPGQLQALGPHSLRFVLANGMHEPIAPLVEATATFTVE